MVMVVGVLAACVKRESLPGAPELATGLSGDKGSVPVTSPGGNTQVRGVSAKLTDAAYRCTLSVSDVPANMRAGEELTLRILITNNSPEIWPKFQPGNATGPAVNLAYLWMHSSGDKPLKEGDRSFLKEDLAPGASTTMELKIRGYPEPGTYLLRIEPVYETVSWFSSKGGCSSDGTITVTP